MLISSSFKDFIWTNHSLEKMAFYNLSQQRVKRVLRHPHRTEKGIVEETLASMQKAGSKKHPYEVWVMYQFKTEKSKNKKQKEKKIIIISAWKYPGISKPGEEIPIPQDILEEVLKEYL
ncbi:MAG: hypothetical protein ACPLXL_01680 [Minisyncoccia bacterium]